MNLSLCQSYNQQFTKQKGDRAKTYKVESVEERERDVI